MKSLVPLYAFCNENPIFLFTKKSKMWKTTKKCLADLIKSSNLRQSMITSFAIEKYKNNFKIFVLKKYFFRIFRILVVFSLFSLCFQGFPYVKEPKIWKFKILSICENSCEAARGARDFIFGEKLVIMILYGKKIFFCVTHLISIFWGSEILWKHENSIKSNEIQWESNGNH